VAYYQPLGKAYKRLKKRQSVQKKAFIFIYVLILSFLILSIGTYIFYKGIMLPPFSRLASRKTKSELVAMGVVQQCMAQLAYPIKKQEKQEKQAGVKEQSTPQQPTSFFDDLKTFFPGLNRSKSYVLQEQIEGIDAEVKLCITSEEGKININSLFDFKEKKINKDFPIDEFSKALEKYQIKGFKAFIEQFFKKRQKPLDDILELNNEEYVKKAFGDNIFYRPPEYDKETEKKVLYLTDLFTVFTDSMLVNPFVLSDSFSIVLDFKRAIAQPEEERNKQIATIEKQKKESFSWDADWKSILQPLYQKPYPPFLVKLFESNPKMRIFSLFCTVTVQGVQTTVYAVLSRSLRVQDEKIMYDIAIMRLYFV
jgi:hypothetical protein